MGLHKLTAGDGYTYLTRQVAVHDATDRGHSGLGDYYSERGESPGRWWGAGLAGLEVPAGTEVTEAQMRSLFGEGCHPDAERLVQEALGAGKSVREAEAAGRLGRAFAVHAGASTFQRTVAQRFVEHNHALGRYWQTPVPPEVRAEIRSQVAEKMFTAEHGRAALDDRERAGFLARASRQQTTAVAGYDLTFTPVKSVSVLWALAGPEVAGQVEAAHWAAVERTLAFAEREVLYTRRGRGGVQQVRARGLIAAVFTHRDARSGDPGLHTHVAVSNKVQDATGRWLAVDGRTLFKANVTLSETYNTLVESELVSRLGVAFVARDGGDGRRPIRELVGVDDRLATAWSSRSASIEARRRELALGFQSRHGRPPTPVESLALAQQATLETRQAKHSARSEADQRAAWRTEAVAVLGSEAGLTAMLAGAVGRPASTAPVADGMVDELAARVVATVQGDRATWQVWHLRAEAQRRVRGTQLGPAQLEAAVSAVVDRAVREHCIAFEDPDPLVDPSLSPAALVRPDGASVYSVHGARLFTSAAIVAAEGRLVAAAHRTGGRRIGEVRVGIALAETAANGLTLNTAQVGMVRALSTSGARLQLALAPAGTGKTTALAVLARTWREGGGTVVGLAPSAVAAQELDTAINGEASDAAGASGRGGRGGAGGCETLSKLVWSLAPGRVRPGWVEAIDTKTLVIVDEAGMAATTDLDAAAAFVLGRGGCVRLVGDDRQLASVAAGGVLREIAATAGAVTLTEVRRFSDPAEAAATLALRDGDPAALGFYADRGRIHVGDLAEATDRAYRRWAADVAAGRRSLLLAPTRELVAELNTRARADRLAADPAAAARPAVPLADGTVASAGDTVITRHNDRRLRVAATDWVKNGDRWTVTATHTDGALTVRRHDLRRTVRLPAGYVADHVRLGYACTIHGAQGTTVDTSHTVLTGQEDRSLLYVAASRGRHANLLYLDVGTDGDPHALVRPETLLPPTPIERLARILARDTAPVAAATALRQATRATVQLRDASARYLDAVTFGAEQLLGPADLDRLDGAADALVTGLSEEPAWPTLRSHLALRALDGHDPLALLRSAVAAGGLAGVLDAAAVLDARLDDGLRAGPLPWLPAIPTALERDGDWGGYLRARGDRVSSLAREVAEEATGWTTATAPAWAQPVLAPADVGLRAALAIWRAVHDVPDTDLRPTGPRQVGRPGEHQAALARAVRRTQSSYPFAQRSWYRSLPEQVHADPWIGPLAQRLARLERAGLPVEDYLRAALALPRPLPDEHAAAALWWRLIPHLGPAAVHGDAHTGDLLRPDWLTELTGRHPALPARALQDSAAWPGLVAAVDEACHQHAWTPGQLLDSCFQTLPTLRPEEVCEALILRIALLTDPPPDLDDPDLAPDEGSDDRWVAPEDILQAPSWLQESPAQPAGSGVAGVRIPAVGRGADTTPPTTGQASRERIVELNRAALNYYRDTFARSWAPAYLRERLGSDLLHDDRTAAGYAPPGRTSLLRHLTAVGATAEELLAAGLVKARDDGDLVDTFWDRLMFPIRDIDGAVVGFVGRRNPTKSDTDFVGPKYLNTRSTAAFAKGAVLFGLAEATPALRAGALPVLTEGPLDALAVTLATDGAAVGVACLGTALTTGQVELLRPWFRADPTNIAVATDGDPAGWKSAQVAFWHLTGRGADPTFLPLPRGGDPATMLEHRGPVALTGEVARRVPLADAMVDQQLLTHLGWSETATRLTLVRETGRIIAARPPEAWLPAIDRVAGRLHLSPGVLHLEVIDQSQERARDVTDYGVSRITEIQDRSRVYRPHRVPGRPAAHRPRRDSPAIPPVPSRPHRPAPRDRPEADR